MSEQVTPEIAKMALERAKQERIHTFVEEMKKLEEAHKCHLEPVVQISPHGILTDFRVVADD